MYFNISKLHSRKYIKSNICLYLRLNVNRWLYRSNRRFTQKFDFLKTRFYVPKFQVNPQKFSFHQTSKRLGASLYSSNNLVCIRPDSLPVLFSKLSQYTYFSQYERWFIRIWNQDYKWRLKSKPKNCHLEADCKKTSMRSCRSITFHWKSYQWRRYTRHNRFTGAPQTINNIM